MGLLDKLRRLPKRFDPDLDAERVAAEQRGEAADLRSAKEGVRNERAREDYASRGGSGYVGPG
jgi:hypothetical protein